MWQLLLGIGRQVSNQRVLYTTTTQLIHSRNSTKQKVLVLLGLPANFACETTRCSSSEFRPSSHTINLVLGWLYAWWEDYRRRVAVWFIMVSTHVVSLLKLLSQQFCACRSSYRWSPYGFSFSKSSQWTLVLGRNYRATRDRKMPVLEEHQWAYKLFLLVCQLSCSRMFFTFISFFHYSII